MPKLEEVLIWGRSLRSIGFDVFVLMNLFQHLIEVQFTTSFGYELKDIVSRDSEINSE